MVTLLFTQGAVSDSTYWLWEDPTSVATAEYVAANADALFYRSETKHVPSSDSTWWLKVPLSNSSDSMKKVFLTFPHEAAADVSAFVANNKNLSALNNGTVVPFDQRQIKTGIIAFEFSLNPKESIDVFLSMKSANWLWLTYKVADINELISAERSLYSKLLISCSLILCFFLVNLSNLVITRERVFLAYAAYLICVGAFTIERFSGFAYLGIPIGYTGISATILTGSTTFFFFCMVIRLLFANRKEFIFIAPLKLTQTLMALLFVLSFVDGNLVAKLYTQGLGVVAPLCVLYALLYAVYKKTPYALTALLGWSFAITGTVAGFLASNGILGVEYHGSMAVGLIVESAIFTLLLSVSERDRSQLNNFENAQRSKMERTAQLATIGEMTATVSHELKQPLSALKLSVGNMIRSISQDPVSAAETWPAKLRRIDKMIDRAVELTDHVRRSSRHSEGDAPTAIIAESLAGCRLMLGQDLANSNIELIVDLADDLPDLAIHPLRLDQILLNILGNGRDVIRTMEPDERWLRVSAKHESSDGVSITIEDSAGGIPEDLLDSVFDKFFTTKDSDTGTGLGLAVCKSIVDDVGGSLSVSNTSNGAQFNISIPCK